MQINSFFLSRHVYKVIMLQPIRRNMESSFTPTAHIHTHTSTRSERWAQMQYNTTPHIIAIVYQATDAN